MNSLISESNQNPYGSQEFDSGPATEAAAEMPGSGIQEKPVPPDVFRYEDYRRFLRDRFAELQYLNPGFSQRGLARKAGIANPGFFNEVIKGRRRLSPAAAAKMAMGLDLSQEDAEYFSALVEFTETREPRAKLLMSKRMFDLSNRKQMLSPREHSQASDAYLENAREPEPEWTLRNPVPEQRTPMPSGEGSTGPGGTPA